MDRLHQLRQKCHKCINGYRHLYYGSTERGHCCCKSNQHELHHANPSTLQLLFSNTSDGCLVNSEYLDGDFEALFDVFTTKSSATAKLVVSFRA